MPTPAHHVTVIGGGLAGLAAALRLSRAGVPVELHEAAEQVGGQVCTEAVDGFLLDRGFQVHNTAYPEPATLLDVQALQLRHLLRGALLVEPGRRHLLADPRQRPSGAAGLLSAPIGATSDRIALARLVLRLLASPVDRLLREPEVTTVDYLRRHGFSARAIDGLFRPFLSGVFLERQLDTSSRIFLLTFRSFVRGSTCLPSAGMGAIPRQLASLLPAGTVRLTSRIYELPTDAAAVVVACDPATAYRLLPELGRPPTLTSVSTYYHACDTPPVVDPVLLLDTTGRSPIANTLVLTASAPSYAPAGKHLVSTSVVGPELPEMTVRQALRGYYGDAVADFEHLRTVRVEQGTPLQSPPMGDLRRSVRVRPGVYVAGAHRDTASTQGALVSGRRAAAAVLADLNLPGTDPSKEPAA